MKNEQAAESLSPVPLAGVPVLTVAGNASASRSDALEGRRLSASSDAKGPNSCSAQSGQNKIALGLFLGSGAM
jgi:hypothetical protein